MEASFGSAVVLSCILILLLIIPSIVRWKMSLITQFVLLSFVVRASMAVFTDLYDVFPAYYFGDSEEYMTWGTFIRNHWLNGTPLPVTPIASSHLAYAYVVGTLMTIWGPYELVAKVFNSFCGALTTGIYLKLTSTVLQPKVVSFKIMGVLLSLWPSYVFWGSQNIRDPLLTFGIAVALYTSVLFWRRPTLVKMASVVSIVYVSSLLRPYILLAYILAVILTVSFLRTFRYVRLVSVMGISGGLLLAGRHVQVAGVNLMSLRPETLSSIRDQTVSALMTVRDVHTALFSGIHFATWTDVLQAVPILLLYTTVMPLPVLYQAFGPGHLGIMLQSMENVGLVAIWVMALRGMMTSVKRPESGLIAFFTISLVLMYAFVEPDLGSISRHRIQYFPILVMFACTISKTREKRCAQLG